MHVKSKRQSNFFDVCSLCKDGCCRNARPPLTLARKKILEARLKQWKIPIENPFVLASYVFPKEDSDGYCVFYDKKTRKCLVHDVKPETCVAGPITFDINTNTQKIEWHLKREEICPLAGKMYKDKEALQRHLELAKKEILRLVRELNPEALRAILKIEEPQTFKVDEDDIKGISKQAN